MKSRILIVFAGVTAMSIFTNPADGQIPAVRIDSVLLARDIDGSGKKDYVVQESRAGDVPQLRDSRIAVYLDADPGTHGPNWATEWGDKFEVEKTLDHSLQMTRGAWLLDIQVAGSDYDGTSLLLVQRGSVREEISHGVDYGHGYLDIKQRGDTVLVEATLDNLKLRGKPLALKTKCKASEWSAVELVFDEKKRGFFPDRTLCASPRYGGTTNP